MPRVILMLALVMAGFFAANGNAGAADSTVTIVTPPKTVVEPTVRIETTKPIKPEPRVAYGCKRVWRCDAEVCEWRRGCWGVYGYMEGPYYTEQLAKRQWERDGWAPPGRVTRY